MLHHSYLAPELKLSVALGGWIQDIACVLVTKSAGKATFCHFEDLQLQAGTKDNEDL
jgi:hypothetical protein